MKKLFVSLMILSLFAGMAIQPASATEEKSYLLVFNGNIIPENLEALVERAGGSIERVYAEIGMATATSTRADFRARATRIPGLMAAPPNVVLQWIDPPTQAVAIDTGYPPESGSADFYFDLQWGHTAIDAPGAWALGYTGAGARVAVLDTGFDMDHPDLAVNINADLSASFVPGEPVDYTLPDPFSHGTHVAGTIAAAQNDFGVIGVAPDAELVLVKVLSDSGSGAWEWIIAGILYAADVDADVINMSLGASLPRRGFESGGEWVNANEVAALITSINRAATYAYQSGTTIITSAGNSGWNLNGTADLFVAPAMSPNVIAISATAPVGWAVDPFNTFLDNLASYSNYGTRVIDFGAPGGDFVYPGNENCTIAGLVRPCWVFDLVFSTGNDSWYWSAGTSMASPHAAGVAALIIGKNGGSMHPAQVEAALRRSADDLGKPGKDDLYGHGRVNARAAVE